jgi:hypothetical protein
VPKNPHFSPKTSKNLVIKDVLPPIDYFAPTLPSKKKSTKFSPKLILRKEIPLKILVE